MPFKPKIRSEEICAVLSEINGVSPERWFIAKNRGKDKKETFAYVVNTTESTIQLVPLKGHKKCCYIDKENVMTFDKSNDIEKLTVSVSDDYVIKFALKDGTKYKLVAYYFGADKQQKQDMKLLRAEYKSASKKEQAKITVLVIILIIITYLIGCLAYDISYYISHHYVLAKDLKNAVESGEYDETLNISMKPYGDKADLELSGDYTTATIGKIRLNLPSNCKLYEENAADDEMTVYTTGFGEESILTVTIDREPFDFSLDSEDEIDEKTELFRKELTDTCKKEFGVPLDSYYYMEMAMGTVNNLENNINYRNYKEVMLYRYLIPIKLSLWTYFDEIYEYNTSSFCGFIKVQNDEMSTGNLHCVWLELYPYDNLDLQYKVVVSVKNGDINDAYKILNSVELV